MNFSSVLVANRGEIAVRVIRACREMGLRAVAVYSEADAGALHVRLAEQAVPIGPAPAAESYLRADRLIEAARQSGAQAIHPGYGFLAESADFAERVAAAGMVFIGPPVSAIPQMGSKTQARDLMRAAGLPVVPGFHEAGGADLSAAAAALGYPLLVKASGGGGGRGMRVALGPAELADALAAARREALAAFGDPAVFIEKFIARARHIEFQVFGDAHGRVVHLFERECSVQRRHQKVIEETPSPLLAQHPDLRERMSRAAVAAAQAVGYTNAGTVEFIVDPDTLAFYFLEMNTRLQVEHPITEAVTGLDLVRLQLSVAAGEPLPFTQAGVVTRGHAIEARLYAEDPAADYLPSTGPLLALRLPQGPGLRVDAGYEAGDTVSRHYDGLLAKVIALGATRTEARERLHAGLGEAVVLGVANNLAFLRDVLLHPTFQAGEATTRFLEEDFALWQPPGGPPPPELLAAVAAADYLAQARAASTPPGVAADDFSPWAVANGFRVGQAR